MADDKNVTEEIQTEEVVQTQETENITPEPTEAQEQAKDDNSSKEYNFRRLEESKKQLEGKVEELEGFIRKAITDKQEPSKETPAEDYLGLGDEDLAEGKHLKAITKELRELKQQIKQEKLASVPDRLTTKFPDFKNVVSTENIEKLKKTEPELYSSITSGSDLYAAGVSAYKTLKALGIAKETYTSQKEQVQNNHNRPMSTQSVKGQGALSEKNIFAGGLTPELKKQLQKEMAEAAKAR